MNMDNVINRGKRINFNIDKCRIEVWQPDFSKPVFSISIKGHFKSFLDPIESRWISNTTCRVKHRISRYYGVYLGIHSIVLINIPKGQALKLEHKHNFHLEIAVKSRKNVDIKKDTELKFAIKELCQNIIRQDMLNDDIELC